jgi:hypothetical protein
VKDIISIQIGSDLGVANSVIPRASNILDVQLGELEYEPTFGIDKRYFLMQPTLFQNDSFKTYLISRLADYQINVTQVMEAFLSLFAKYTFFINQAFDPFNRISNQEIIDNALADADGEYLTDADGEILIDG